MSCIAECYRAILKLFIKDERENLYIILAFIRSERNSLANQHFHTFGLLHRTLATGSPQHLRRTAQREFELSHQLTILQTAIDNCRILLSNWDNFMSDLRNYKVREAFFGLWSSHQSVGIPRLSDWLKRQGGRPHDIMAGPIIQPLQEYEFPDFFTDLLIRIGPLSRSRDSAVRENLKNAGLLREFEFEVIRTDDSKE
jgi:hypothetical protein